MDYFEADVARSQMFTSYVIKARMYTSSVGNVIYHKFSHDAAFYTLNGKNVNVMLEYLLSEHLAVNKTLYFWWLVSKFKEQILKLV